MATNPIPKGTKNLTVNVTDALHKDLKKLAKASSMSLSQYVRHVLEHAKNQNLKIRTEYIVDDGTVFIAAEDPPKNN
ncbi:hypothetical protein MLD52_19570 [Puniceicoccaceae bacterium K14]|nr:hypothetical protein [Puniceicoccaceae bacterium K14]